MKRNIETIKIIPYTQYTRADGEPLYSLYVNGTLEMHGSLRYISMALTELARNNQDGRK